MSPEGTKDYLDLAIIPALKKAENALNRLKSRPILIVERGGKAQEMDKSHWDYEDVLKTKLTEVQQIIEGWKQEQSDITEWIQTWEPAPLYGQIVTARVVSRFLQES